MNRLTKCMTAMGFLVCLSSPAMAWTLETDDKDYQIKVWTQPVENSDYRAFKGEIFIHATVDQVAEVVTDTSHYPEWYHNNKFAKKLKQINKNQGLTYSVTQLPWPVSNRDSVTLSTKKTLPNGDIHIHVVAQPDAYPRQEGLIRVPKLDGSWKIENVDNHQTKVTLQIAAEPGGSIPSWLANGLVVDMPFYSLTNLKARIENKK